MAMVGLSATQLGSSRLVCSAGADATLLRSSHSRKLTADELLANGPKGGKGSAQELRHRSILASQKHLYEVALTAEDNPHAVHKALASKNHLDVSVACRSHVQENLAKGLNDKLRRAFLEASLANSRSSLRVQKLQKVREEVKRARPLAGVCSEKTQNEIQQFQTDTAALEAVARAQALQEEARRSAEQQSSESPPTSPDSSTREPALIVQEAMEMLRKWTKHSQVAQALCDALLRMVSSCGDTFKDEMDKKGVGVLASTVADIWAGRADVCRVAQKLLSIVSIELLVLQIEEQLHAGEAGALAVALGLEVLNQRARDDREALDDMKRFGGVEMLDLVEPKVAQDKMTSLHVTNLRRRLQKSKVKSIRPREPAPMPPEDVVKLRGCFESIDVDCTGYIDAQELDVAFKMLGMKAQKQDLAAALREVDVDGSGTIEWPEFLWLMSRFGERQSIESQFTEERLAELREVFNLFDADGSGSLDAKELGIVMRSVGLSPTDFEIRAMINEVDADKSGCIEWPEFLYLMSRKVVHPENQHRLAWEFFDRDREGKVDKQEFIEKMQNLSPDLTTENMEEMIFEAKFEDPDLDVITYQEFVKMIMRP